MALADGGMVLEAALGERDALILQVRDLCDAAAAEVVVLDGIVGELRFRRVNDDLAVLGLAMVMGMGLMRPSLQPQPEPGSFLANILCSVTVPLPAIRLWATGPQWKRMILSSSSP